MASIYSDDARFSVQSLEEDRPERGSVLVTATLFGSDNDTLRTKLGLEFHLPPEKAIELAKQILKCAYALIPVAEAA